MAIKHESNCAFFQYVGDGDWDADDCTCGAVRHPKEAAPQPDAKLRTETTLQQLAKAIADSGKWVLRPGMAVRDPETGEQWRIAFRQHRLPDRGWLMRPGECLIHETQGPSPLACAIAKRALAAGPDLSDDVTVLGLLADMPRHGMRVGLHTFWWTVAERDEFLETHETRAEAIARAWLSAHKDTP